MIRPPTVLPPVALDLRDVGVQLAGRRVLEGITLQVRAGDFLGVVGPNGAGKTTMLRSILGLVATHNGTIDVGDRDGAGSLGYVPQRHEFAWDFPITVEDTVVLGRVGRIGFLRRPSVADHRAASDALDRVQMGDLRRRPIGELSGGQRQRVLVARALAVEPHVLLLDEPCTGLDVPTQELLMGLVAQLADDGAAVMMTTHDLPGAMQSCTHLCLLDRTVVAAGTPAELEHPEPWMRAFGFSPTSPLLALLTGGVGSQKGSLA